MGVDLNRAIRITRTDVGYLYTAGAGVIHSRKNGNMDFGRALTRALNTTSDSQRSRLLIKASRYQVMSCPITKCTARLEAVNPSTQSKVPLPRLVSESCE